MPNTIPRARHNISRADISEGAIKVLYQLKKAGFEGYLVGGSVRDLLLGRKPKDFDIVTNAHPEQVRQLFKRKCILIGRRFRLAHVRFGREVIEVATFRSRWDEIENGDRITVNGRIVRDNVYSTSISEDVWRRDFSINSLYYNIADFSVIDFAGGMADLEARTIRLIGDARMRYREDAVRTLRAIRFAAKLDFRLHPGTEEPIREFGKLLEEVPPARLFDEALKLFHGGHGLSSFRLLRHYGLFGQLFPATDTLLTRAESGFFLRLVERALTNTDARIAQAKPVTPAFLLAVLLWEPMQHLARRNRKRGMLPIQAFDAAGREVIDAQIKHVMLPRRVSVMTKEIWSFQPRLMRTSRKRSKQLLHHPRFRAAYDFLVLRAEAGEKEIEDIAQWWTDFQENNHPARKEPVTKHPRFGKKQ
uniref:Poly(A) polymerase I n=1 Tax=Candidatus Kentrum sp. FM TaxID=2126340 RepID=A0A450TA66_9GAMM|nr:MAG: poly(A) polymerase [Candidatus Kentron sp. FM]VFJ64312.1 MAG: poly(A) polymerase [Candidatus Kentron sp. FM]VFK16995.1 MAG: poly(A) polymerase [Candidatus Kentron sp. FM]